MDFTFLGTGDAFTTEPDNFQSNGLIISDFPSVNDRRRKARLLVDCGSDVRRSLKQQGLTHRDIDAVYISHLHSDHVGGMEWLGFSTYFDPQCHKPLLFIDESLVGPIWDNCLKAGMELLDFGNGRLEDLFTVFSIPVGGAFEWGGATFATIPAVHLTGGADQMMSYGLLIDSYGTKTYFTADVQFSPENLGPVYDAADRIFHDCETNPNRTGGHSHVDDLVTLPEAVRRKMWLYHYQPVEIAPAVRSAFGGWVKAGQTFNIGKNE